MWERSTPCSCRHWSPSLYVSRLPPSRASRYSWLIRWASSRHCAGRSGCRPAWWESLGSGRWSLAPTYHWCCRRTSATRHWSTAGTRLCPGSTEAAVSRSHPEDQHRFYYDGWWMLQSTWQKNFRHICFKQSFYELWLFCETTEKCNLYVAILLLIKQESVPSKKLNIPSQPHIWNSPWRLWVNTAGDIGTVWQLCGWKDSIVLWNWFSCQVANCAFQTGLSDFSGCLHTSSSKQLRCENVLVYLCQ